MPSAERVALDRSFYTKIDLRVLGVKVTNQQGPEEKGCVTLLYSPGGVWTGGSLEMICGLLFASSRKKNLLTDVKFTDGFW